MLYYEYVIEIHRDSKLIEDRDMDSDQHRAGKIDLFRNLYNHRQHSTLATLRSKQLRQENYKNSNNLRYNYKSKGAEIACKGFAEIKIESQRMFLSFSYRFF